MGERAGRCRNTGGQALRAWKSLLAVAMLLTALAACTPSAPNITSDGVVPGGVPLTDEHTLAPGDEVEIRFPYTADLNDRVLIGPDGRGADRCSSSTRWRSAG